MKKTYWWRFLVLFLVLFFMIVDYLTYCHLDIRVCFWGNNSFLRTIFHLSIPLFISSIILFLVSDNVFKKWLFFAFIWLGASMFFIARTPEYPIGFLDPDREQVSIWMSSLFLVISLILLVMWQFKEKKSSK
ncbi:MAG: hypothetical protein GX765_02240 [Candidatus Moranbacteria bacterium]|nr:hypothetical protein [Candidatus Moranbacteria bacterium]